MPILAAALLLLTLVLAQVAVAVYATTLGLGFVVLFVLAVSLIGGTLFATTAYSVFFGAPYVPTDRARVDAMMSLTGLKPGEKLYDLGSGDGRIVIAAAKAGAHAEGWEISPYLWLYSTWQIRRQGLGDRAKIHLGSYWEEHFRDADVVTLFLITQQMGRMQRKLQDELRPGGRVISFAFKFPDWQHESKDRGLFLYRQK
jgi:hypothetical protein